MASLSYIELNQGDTIETVIKKCNTNFRSLSIQKQQQDKSNNNKFVKEDEIADVAKTGDYDDLIDKPRIPKVFYGTSSTAASTQTKQVDCPEFTAADMIAGTVLFCRFEKAQSFDGTPNLNINDTGSHVVSCVSTTALPRYWWKAGEMVCFVYEGTRWLVVKGGYATTTYYGPTKLSSSVTSTSESLAATAKAVKTAYDFASNKLNAEWQNDDILWVIENDTVGEVMKKTDVTGYHDLTVRCVGEDGNPCFTPLCLIPKDTYQNYVANGKTFKMKIATDDSNRLWWVVPNGTWELWMR